MDRLLDTHFPRAPADVASGRPSYLRVTAASLWAGLLQLVVVVPVELVKCKLQVQQDSVKITIGAKARAAVAAQAAAHPPPVAALGAPLYSGPWDCVKQLYRARGIPGLFAGGWVTAWRDVPAYAAWFLAYVAPPHRL
jgi:solute carrier family 25 carnitine/acylcarnitine transporter 20/29